MKFIPRWLASLVACALLTAVASQSAYAVYPACTPFSDSVSRVVAIGDVHGDYERFVEVLRSTSLINEDNDWIGENATLVQLGDSTDRGPDSRKVIDLLRKLKGQARKTEGKVEVVIGNHEIMNITGDLRYVHPGEYEAFRDKNSQKRLDRYYKRVVAALKADSGEGRSFALPEGHREQWDKQHPLGFVKHREAWSPEGEYGRWARLNPAVVQVGDTLFLHGGLSEKYSLMSLNELNKRVRRELADPRKWQEGSVIDDPDGPFWYRGWARMPETEENLAKLNEVLARFDAKRMVVGHTPILNTVLPRFGGKVVLVDAGMSEYYFGANAALELLSDCAFSVTAGRRTALPEDNQSVVRYLEQVARNVEDDARINAYIDSLSSETIGDEALGNEASDNETQIQ